jgi:TonB family protein
MKTPLMTLLLAATLLCGLASASAADQEFGAGSGVTLTRAAWAYRIVRLGERQPCKMLQQADCSSTRVEISNNSDAELACAGQVYLLLGEKKVGYIENFGTLVTARGKETPFEFEIDAAIDPARSFVICNTTAERDEADTGDPSFAKVPPEPCKFKLAATPPLDDFYANAARAADEQGLVRVRVVFTTKNGRPVPLGITQSSGFYRVDRSALLAASRMTFSTNCPGTFKELPIRFQLTN